MNGKARKKLTAAIPWIVVVLFCAMVLYCCLIDSVLCVVHYSLNAKVSDPIRIVQLTDLHNASFGNENTRLVKLVEKQHPDLIFMCGDMLNAFDPNPDAAISLVHELSSVAPVYYGYGNHEKTWERRFGQDLSGPLEAAGALVVDNSYVDAVVCGNELRVGGYMGYYQAPLMTEKDPAMQQRDYEFAASFQHTERLKLLINHIPTQWVDWDYVDKFSVDFVFSGHYHGGVIRIPFIDQGLFAPYVGWFPPFTKGVYAGARATCILSAGLGNEHLIPRLGNPPEIVVVDLVPSDIG